jgi:hypothetical protein
MPKIGDVFDGSSKIGELHTGGNGGWCVILAVLFILSPIIGLAAVIGDQIRNHQQATDAQATVTAQAPILAQPDYYSAKARAISINGPIGLGYQNNSDQTGAVYFHVIFTNTDSTSHDVTAEYSFTVNDSGAPFDWGFSDVDQTVEYQLNANGQTDEKISFEGGTISNFRKFHIRLLTVDGNPAEDPRVALSKLSLSARPVVGNLHQAINGDGPECEVDVTNHDTAPHIVALGYDDTYTYKDLGDTKTGMLSIAADPSSYSYDIPAGGTRRGWTDSSLAGAGDVVPVSIGVDQSFDQPVDISTLQTLTVKDFVIVIADPGDNNVPSQILTKTFSPAGCVFK